MRLLFAFALTIALAVVSPALAVDKPLVARKLNRHTPRSATCEQPATIASRLGSGIDRANFDTGVRPQDDLFRAVNGAWLAKTPIPPDRSDYGSFVLLAERAEKNLLAIIEECAADKNNPPGSERQKVGDLYATYMDEARAERLGARPIAGRLAAVDAIANKADLVRVLAQLAPLGVGGPFGAGVGTDAKNSSEHLLGLWQGGASLPDRDYYWDAKFAQKLSAFGAHVERMLALTGVSGAKQAASDIVALETRLARAQWSKVDCRDANKTYNKMTREQLARLAPGFDWNLYLDTIGAQAAREVDVAQPSFFTAMAEAFDTVPLATWKAWLRWRIVQRYASLLNKDMADADFAFNGQVLRGIPENRPRWKRGVSMVEGALGMAVGKLYVERHFPPAAKARMDAMVQNVLAAYRRSINELEWMSPETKKKALAKLATFNPKIGYPKKWRDYSALRIERGDLVGNSERAATVEFNRNLAKLGQPVDRDEWFMTPQTVNAYYNGDMNEIVFPAAILQPPFFNIEADDAVNYGGIGAVIGHEAGHGFDDQGSKRDAQGNLVNWWAEADRAEFDKRGAVLVAQYDRFEPFPGFKVNGRFTLGENIGDLAGLTIGYAAYQLSLGGKPAPVIDGLTGDQRFFIGWAQVWCRKHREDDLKNRLVVDPHSPAEYRANGTPRNIPAFHKAFNTKPGDKMYLPPGERVKIW